MRDESTASCVVNGDNNTEALGIAESNPSYRAKAAFAGPIAGTSRSQSSRWGGNLPRWYLTGFSADFSIEGCVFRFAMCCRFVDHLRTIRHTRFTSCQTAQSTRTSWPRSRSNRMTGEV